MSKRECACKDFSNVVRIKCGTKLGIAFMVIASFLCAFTIPRFVLVAISPIYQWRFIHCHNDDQFMFILEAISQFFIYGFIIGFVFCWFPRKSASQMSYLAYSFIASIVFMLLILDDSLRPESCG